MNHLPSYIRVSYKQSASPSADYIDYAQLCLNKMGAYPKEKENSMASACVYFQRGDNFQKCIEYAEKFYPQLTTKDCKEDVLKSWAYSLKQLGLWQQLIRLQAAHLKVDNNGIFTYLDIANAYEMANSRINQIHYLELAVAAGEANGADLEKLSDLCLSIGEMEKAGKYLGKAASNANTPR